jgi:hypothetical protein
MSNPKTHHAVVTGTRLTWDRQVLFNEMSSLRSDPWLSGIRKVSFSRLLIAREAESESELVRVTLQLTVSQSVSKSWCRAQSRAFDQRSFFFFFKVTVLSFGGAFSDQGKQSSE